MTAGTPRSGQNVLAQSSGTLGETVRAWQFAPVVSCLLAALAALAAAYLAGVAAVRRQHAGRLPEDGLRKRPAPG